MLSLACGYRGGRGLLDEVDAVFMASLRCCVCCGKVRPGL